MIKTIETHFAKTFTAGGLTEAAIQLSPFRINGRFPIKTEDNAARTGFVIGIDARIVDEGRVQVICRGDSIPGKPDEYELILETYQYVGGNTSKSVFAKLDSSTKLKPGAEFYVEYLKRLLEAEKVSANKRYSST